VSSQAAGGRRFPGVLAGQGEMPYSKSGGDDDAAELGCHVSGGGFGLACVPRGGRSAFVQVGEVVAGGVPGDGGGLASDLEREGPLDGGRGAACRGR
jgi:hypothetical protein